MPGIEHWVLLGATVAIVGTAAVTALLQGRRERQRTAPLRQEAQDQPITFRTDLSLVSFSGSPPRGKPGGLGVDLIIRSDVVQVGSELRGFGCCYFRAPETTIYVSRNPLWIYGVDGRREWIVVSSRQDGNVLVSMTKKFFLDEVWNALVAAGALPTSSGPARRTKLWGREDPQPGAPG